MVGRLKVSEVRVAAELLTSSTAELVRLSYAPVTNTAPGLTPEMTDPVRVAREVSLTANAVDAVAPTL